jgi:hypothetical protein
VVGDASAADEAGVDEVVGVGPVGLGASRAHARAAIPTGHVHHAIGRSLGGARRQYFPVLGLIVCRCRPSGSGVHNPAPLSHAPANGDSPGWRPGGSRWHGRCAHRQMVAQRRAGHVTVPCPLGPGDQRGGHLACCSVARSVGWSSGSTVGGPKWERIHRWTWCR